GPVADPLAGLKVDEGDVERLLDGGRAPDRAARKLQTALDADVERAADALGALLGQPGQFADIVAGATLDLGDAAVLAFLGAVELEPRRQRLVAYVQDDVTKPRPTLALL